MKAVTIVGHILAKNLKKYQEYYREVPKRIYRNLNKNQLLYLTIFVNICK